MENQKNQDDSYITASAISSDTITFTNNTIASSGLFTITDSTSTFNYTLDTTSNYIFTDSTFSTYNDPYRELEESKQQQEKEEELRKENSCLQEAWNEYQLILKLLEDNECDKYVEKRYGMKK